MRLLSWGLVLTSLLCLGVLSLSRDTPLVPSLDPGAFHDAPAQLARPRPWYGLCRAFGGTTLAGFLLQVRTIPELAILYRLLDHQAAHMVIATTDTDYFVAYVAHGVFGWSTRPVRVRHGEWLITDRAHVDDERTGFLIRGWCCNQLSRVPRQPTLGRAEEPTPAALTPEEAVAVPPWLPGLPTGPGSPLPPVPVPPALLAREGAWQPLSHEVRAYPTTGCSTGRAPPAASTAQLLLVPESATGTLVGLGVCGLGLWRWRTSRRREVP